MKEIGGYIEFEHYNGKQFHEGAIKLNCSRNCLAYLIKLHDIKHIYIPYFLCDSVLNICKKYGVEVSYFHIDEKFLPVLPKVDFSKAWLYVVNYYGQLSNGKIAELSKSIPNMIVDNVQAFFQLPVENLPIIYNCRKFFGVPDGAYLYSSEEFDEVFGRDVSYDQIEYLLGRFEISANSFYSKYVEHEKTMETRELKNMSLLTENLMCSLDYRRIQNIRTENFKFLDDQFKNINKLKLTIPTGAFAYPLYLVNGSEIRRKLQQEKIYIPTLWPDVFDICKESDLEYDYAKNILPLPVDQRYGKEEMTYITKRIKACIN